MAKLSVSVSLLMLTSVVGDSLLWLLSASLSELLRNRSIFYLFFFFPFSRILNSCVFLAKDLPSILTFIDVALIYLYLSTGK